MSDCRAKKRRCRRCSNAGMFLRLVAGADHADHFLWNETTFPAGSCSDIAPKLWREGWRVIGWRLGLLADVKETEA